MMKHIIFAALVGTAVIIAPAAVAEHETLELAVGETQTITLPGNPTTGYVWRVAECPEVVQVNLAFEPKAQESGPPLCGAPSATVVSLTGLKAGQGVVKLVYARPWEKGKAPADTRAYTVTVK